MNIIEDVQGFRFSPAKSEDYQNLVQNLHKCTLFFKALHTGSMALFELFHFLWIISIWPNLGDLPSKDWQNLGAPL